MSSQIPQCKLKSSIVAIDDDLQRDQGVLIDGARCVRLIWASHDRRSGSVSYLTCSSSSVMDQAVASFNTKLLKRVEGVIVALELRMWKGNGSGNEVTRFKLR